MAIPSKGRMAEDTIKLLQARMTSASALLSAGDLAACTLTGYPAGVQECQLSVYKPNPRQYIATIPQVGLDLVPACC